MFMTIDSFVTLLAMAMALRCVDILVVDCNYDCYRIRQGIPCIVEEQILVFSWGF